MGRGKAMKKKAFQSIAGKLVTNMARKVAVVDANSACAWLGYQQKLPEGVKKLRKF